MTQHWDALGVAFATTGLFVFLTLMLLKANDDHAAGLRATYRALREVDYQRVRAHYVAQAKASLARVRTLEERAAQAVDVAGPDEPIPYLPVFADGALPSDVEAEFDELIRRAFIAEGDAR